MPPVPCPPPPPRHPDLWRDSDGYTRKEVDEADARTLTSANAYADGLVGSAQESASAAQAAADAAAATAETVADSVSEMSESVSKAEAAVEAAERAAESAAESASSAIDTNKNLVVVDGALWYYSAISASLADGKWKSFVCNRLDGKSGNIGAKEFLLGSQYGIETTDGLKMFLRMWNADSPYSLSIKFTAGLTASGTLEFYEKDPATQHPVFEYIGSKSKTMVDASYVNVSGKLFAKYYPTPHSEYVAWTDAPYRVKLADVLFSNSFDTAS